jgi:hypothetical protein
MKRSGIVGVFTLMLALNPADAFAGGRPLVVDGAGSALLTDPDLNLEALGINVPPPGGEYLLGFAIAGAVQADGTATGAAEFVFGRAFSHVFDADVIFLACRITGGTVNPDGSLTLTGTSHERDFVLGQGIIFEEISPFEMVITGDGEFTLTWCAFPGEFDVEVIRGRLSVR